DDVIGHAQTLSRVVARTVAPVRLTGIAASIGLLAAAGVLLARERQRDLRLRLLRGVGPARLAAHMVAVCAPAAAIGTVVGLARAVLSVVTIGPTSELEPRIVRQAIGATAFGLVVAVVVVGVVSAATANATVDGRRRAWSLRHLIAPGIVALLALTIVS